MPPYTFRDMLVSEILPDLALLCAILVPFFLTMAARVFPHVAEISDSSDDAPLARRIREFAFLPHFREGIAFGRVSGCALALLLLVRRTAPLFGAVEPGWLRASIQVGALLPCIYAVAVLLPGIVAESRPDSLAALTLAAFRPAWLLCSVPAQIAHRIRAALLARTGNDPQFGFLTEEERRKLSDESAPGDEDALEEDEKQMIRNLFEIGDTTAVEVMTPRIDVDAIPVTASLQEVLREFCSNKRTRIPVYEGTVDNIVGVLNCKDLMECLREDAPKTFDLRSMLRPAQFVPEGKLVVELLREMRHKRNHMAVVVDEFGGTSGIVTIEDILEEIVGEIYDEKDASAPRVEMLRPGVYQVDPMISLGDLEEELQIDLDLEHIEETLDVETLGGLIQAKLGAIPRKGSRVTCGPIQVRVLKTDGLRIVRALVFVRSETERDEEK